MTTILLDTETNGQEPQEPIEVAWVELEEGPAFFLNRKTNIHIDRYKPELISTYGALAPTTSCQKSCGSASLAAKPSSPLLTTSSAIM